MVNNRTGKVGLFVDPDTLDALIGLIDRCFDRYDQDASLLDAFRALAQHEKEAMHW